MQKLKIDRDYLLEMLVRLVNVPSPCGFTDRIVHLVGEELETLRIPFELTRRGAIRAHLKGQQRSPDRGIVAHLDTLGALVRSVKPNGRLAVAPIGTWSSRFAEGARVTIYTEQGERRGTVLPLLASGHTFGERVDAQPTAWDQVEVRVDEVADTGDDLHALGFQIGDAVAFDPNCEVMRNGYIVSRHLDDKAGVASILAAAKAITDSDAPIPLDCHLLFTISEEVGSGASHVLHGDVAELVAIDNATNAPGQNSMERGVTVAMMDSSGPFDYHLTQKLIQVCQEFAVPFSRDVFRDYRCDAASAIEAGNDLRTALVCFSADASHGYERTHIESLHALAQLLSLYIQSPPTFYRDRLELGPLEGFPTQSRDFQRFVEGGEGSEDTDTD
jgi:peptidase M42 family hydrolase